MTGEVSGALNLLDYSENISQVLKAMHGDVDLSEEASKACNELVGACYLRMEKEAVTVAGVKQCPTLTPEEMEEAMKLLVPAELAGYARAEGAKAVYKCCS